MVRYGPMWSDVHAAQAVATGGAGQVVRAYVTTTLGASRCRAWFCSGARRLRLRLRLRSRFVLGGLLAFTTARAASSSLRVR